MEVAGQWRREWAGTAEYGKVIEGGVTKRVARAVEVLHASAPGARVRVLRAAYHATTGLGEPASSYMLQSSRRMISSGYDFLKPTPSISTPLEISSVPLEMSDTNVDKQNYKVTEPDDLEISEPSKWRSVSDRNSIRLPSEESSSTDNASIIDLDLKNNRYSFRKQEFEDSHENVKSNNFKHKRVSPLLDSPVTLNTLKYKSLLSDSNEWNNRRKSYSFEDTEPLNKFNPDRYDRFAIESSTDSGICKSSEIVNDTDYIRHKIKERNSEPKEETFKDWLFKNRLNTVVNQPMKPLKEHSITPERLAENNITLQSSGKVCITLPITIETDGDEYKKHQIVEEDRKAKKVEFCKTELHFAVDTGTVNIIATDEKPPPTNDFRRRRSAFIPINDRFEKSVTLFGDKADLRNGGKSEFYSNRGKDEIGENEENTAATKSILKNKIPKPKPYLLGENMILGNGDNFISKSENIVSDDIATGVAVINSQLKADRVYGSARKSHYSTKYVSNAYFCRTTSEGSSRTDNNKNSHETCEIEKNNKSAVCNDINDADTNLTSSVKRKSKILQTSPILGRTSNSRQLRDTDLTYFGVKQNQELMSKERRHQQVKLYDQNKEEDEIFESVRLVRKVSSSVCSSEIESDEAPEYQNISSKISYTPVPAPRSRIKYGRLQTQTMKSENLNSIKEQESEGATLRRNRLRRQDTSNLSSRSITEPPKINKIRDTNYCATNNSKKPTFLRTKNNGLIKDQDPKVELDNISVSEDGTSLYVNLNERNMEILENGGLKTTDLPNKPEINDTRTYTHEQIYKTERIKEQKGADHDEFRSKRNLRRSDSQNSKNNIQDKPQSRSKTKTKRTEKLVTPELSHNDARKIKSEKLCETKNMTDDKNIAYKGKDHYIRPSCHHKIPDDTTMLKKETKTLKVIQDKGRDLEEKYVMKNNKHTPYINTNIGSVLPKIKPDLLLNNSSELKEIKRSDRKFYEPKKSRRSEYVINYDDKNGTVSSVRKIKPIRHTSDVKKNSIRENKENSYERNIKSKQLNKIALQKLPDQQRYQYGKGYIDTARKSHVQRACLLL